MNDHEVQDAIRMMRPQVVDPPPRNEADARALLLHKMSLTKGTAGRKLRSRLPLRRVGVTAFALVAVLGGTALASNAGNSRTSISELFGGHPGFTTTVHGAQGVTGSVTPSADDQSFCFDAPSDPKNPVSGSTGGCGAGFDASGVSAGWTCSNDHSPTGARYGVSGFATRSVSSITVITATGASHPVDLQGAAFHWFMQSIDDRPTDIVIVNGGREYSQPNTNIAC
jgi:hypothetical protein